MKKYWHVVNVGIQNNLTYRFNFFARTVFGFIPLIAVIYVWRAIYAGKPDDPNVGTYSLAQMISYYLIVTIVDALTAVNEDDWQIAADIKDGNISQFLLKPINYLMYRLCLFVSGRLTYIAVMLAFWVLEVSTFIFILYAFEYIASGHLFPLDILPAPLAKVLAFTPFPYQLYLPVSIYMGKTAGPDVVRGVLIQAAWVIVAWLAARFAWSRGLKKYSAVGG